MLARGPLRRIARTEDGASAVEFALVVPMLIMLTFGIIGFGTLFAQQLSLGNAARESARFGVVDNRTCDDILGAARGASTTIGMSGSDVEIVAGVGADEAAALASPVCTGPSTDQPCEGSEAGSSIYVRVKYDAELVIPLIIAEPTFPISGTGVFRCEFS